MSRTHMYKGFKDRCKFWTWKHFPRKKYLGGHKCWWPYWETHIVNNITKRRINISFLALQYKVRYQDLQSTAYEALKWRQLDYTSTNLSWSIAKDYQVVSVQWRASRWAIQAPEYFYTDRSKVVRLLWFLTVTCSCCPYLYFGSAIMLVTYFVNFR